MNSCPGLSPSRQAPHTGFTSCERRESRAAVLRRSEQTHFIVCERRRSRRNPSDARAVGNGPAGRIESGR
jgi:hypothetical protein